MRLLNDNGRFQFIKNEQVVIDKQLIKWIELEAIKKASKKQNDSSITQAQNESSSQRALALDDLYVHTLSQMNDAVLMPFSRSEHAKEFNQKFSSILTGELDLNKYSVQVTLSNWDVVGTPFDERIEKPKGVSVAELWTVVKHYFESKNKEKREFNDGLRVVDFFKSIHILSTKERDFSLKLEGLLQMLQNAQQMGQKAQIATLCSTIIIQIYEAILASHGFDKYILFSELSKIKSPGKRVVDIDYVANYTRVIPDEIIEKKKFCDLLRVFDNYCVMYYDPTGQSYKKTEAARRDPILFGVINHSPKLYYIGDWVDDKCDLTLEQIASRLSVSTLK